MTALAAACSRPAVPEATSSQGASIEARDSVAVIPRPYPVSQTGGTPATGPGIRYNACERIWCMTHKENFYIDHFLTGHHGWILHDENYGDVFSPNMRKEGPPFKNARVTVLLLCGSHVHPYLLGKYGGSIRHTGYNPGLGYSRSHFNAYGTRLDPCCTNGLGFGYIHSMAGRQFRFHDLDEYRSNPDLGWQKPFGFKTASN